LFEEAENAKDAEEAIAPKPDYKTLPYNVSRRAGMRVSANGQIEELKN
jgi:hypothetical protein